MSLNLQLYLMLYFIFEITQGGEGGQIWGYFMWMALRATVV